MLYFFQVWGGGGGNSTSKGGYASGYLYIQEKTTIYVAVGGKSVDCSSSLQNESSYNGGGKCQSTGFSIATYYSGGGASDIRILENNVNNRVIVAGGAGGSSNSYAFGGGESGGESTENGAGKAGTSCIKDDDCPQDRSDMVEMPLPKEMEVDGTVAHQEIHLPRLQQQ